MKAWVLEKFNGPQSIELKDMKTEILRADQVRVRIQACGINNKDIYISKGVYYRTIKSPVILGSDISGTVIEIGSSVKSFSLNNRVVISPIMGCGTCKYCLDEEENKCPDYESLIDGFSQEIVVSEKSLIKIPDNLSYIEAAALPISYLTAWNMLFNKAQLKESETILIWGASSGVGTAAITLMKSKENIIAVAGGREKVAKLRALGIERVIDYKVENVSEQVLAYTEDQGVDVIFDPVGKVAWDKNFDILKHNGRHVNCARNTGSEATIDLGKLFAKQITIYGAKSGTKKDLIKILGYLSETKSKPVISKVFAFTDAKAAMAYLESGKHFGKVVLQMNSEGEINDV